MGCGHLTISFIKSCIFLNKMYGFLRCTQSTPQPKVKYFKAPKRFQKSKHRNLIQFRKTVSFFYLHHVKLTTVQMKSIHRQSNGYISLGCAAFPLNTWICLKPQSVDSLSNLLWNSGFACSRRTSQSNNIPKPKYLWVDQLKQQQILKLTKN